MVACVQGQHAKHTLPWSISCISHQAADLDYWSSNWTQYCINKSFKVGLFYLRCLRKVAPKSLPQVKRKQIYTWTLWGVPLLTNFSLYHLPYLQVQEDSRWAIEVTEALQTKASNGNTSLDWLRLILSLCVQSIFVSTRQNIIWLRLIQNHWRVTGLRRLLVFLRSHGCPCEETLGWAPAYSFCWESMKQRAATWSGRHGNQCKETHGRLLLL